ncbi:uncharacterized protein [Rutidosis leptorrhynchoides]|uniref:uncharacterized protein n=1 Tax=Rutidosis leptorrhynchoides TaxID=125765 RepID=UPI003A99BC76
MAAVVEPTPLNLLTIDVNGAVVRVKGNKIRASVPKRWISFYEPTFVEGKYLELSNFGVVDCDDKLKLIPNALKISIFRSTTITVCPLFDIATEGFSLVHFQKLLEWRFSKDAVFDVLGALVEMKPMRIKRENGVDNKSLEFTLKDNSGIAIRCALWAHHATRVFECVSARKNDIDSIVLLMHNCKLREWQEGVSLQSTLGDIQTQTLLEMAIENFNKPEAKNCQEVGDVHEVSLRGRVSNFCDEEAWYTYACNVCHKKVEAIWCIDTTSTKYNCVNCGDVNDVSPRIRVTIEVEDTSGSCSLVVFDTQLSKMMKKSVNWLKMLAECSVDAHVIPNELKELLYKPFVWMIRITDFNLKYNYPGYTVDNVTDDMEVFEAIDTKLKSGATVHTNASTSADITPVKFTKRKPTACKELNEMDEVNKYVLRGKISGVATEDGWISFTCQKCKTMAGPKYGHKSVADGFECSTCGVITGVVQKIRTALEIEDETGRCNLGLFDDSLATLLKLTVEQLQDLAENAVNPTTVPNELNAVLGKQYVFSVRVTDCNIQLNYRGYTVLNLSDSEEEIALKTPSTSSSTKRKTDHGPDDDEGDTLTGGTGAGIAALKIPRMDDL